MVEGNTEAEAFFHIGNGFYNQFPQAGAEFAAAGGQGFNIGINFSHVTGCNIPGIRYRCSGGKQINCNKITCMRQLLLLLVLLAGISAAAQNSYKIENNELVSAGKIIFKTGTATISLPESEAALNHVKSYLADKSYISTLRIEAHVSGTANDQALSESRALAVYKWLVNNGVDCKRLIAVGFGNTKPIAEGDTLQSRAANTRISFFNAALRGHLIGGMPADGGGKVVGDTCL